MKHLALRTSLLYGLFAAAWILFSDRALVGLVSDPIAIGRLSTYKGWAFVAVTGLLLYGTLKTQIRRWQEEMAARVEAERGFRESEERYRVAVERSHDGVVLIRGDKPIFVNGRFLDIFGYDTAEEVLGTSLFKTVHPDDREMVARYVSGGEAGEPMPTSYEFRGVTKEGAVKWIEASVGGVTYLGEPGGLAYLRDITDRKTMEEALRKSEAEYRELVERANSIILRMDVLGNVTFINEYAQSFFGYGEQEIVGRNVVGTIVPEAESTGRDLKEMIEDIGRNPETDATNVNENMRRDGERVWIAWTNKPIYDDNNRAREILCIGNDITEARRSEAALRRSEAKFRAVVENGNDGILFIDANGIITYRSPSYDRINGYTDEERVGHSGFEVVHPEDLDRVRQCLARALQHPEAPVSCEYRIRHKEGGWLWLEATGQNLLDNPDVRSIVVAARNITDRKRAEAAVKESEERYRFLFDSISDAVFVHPITEDGLPGPFTEVNEAAGALLGYSREEFLRMTPADFSTLEGSSSIAPMMRRLQKEKRTVREGTHVAKDGRRIPVEVSLHAFDFRGRPTVLATVRDITDRKAAEKALRESEAKFRSYIELSPLAVFVGDREGRIVDVNPAAVALLGYDAGSLSGTHVWEMHPLEDREEGLRKFAAFGRDGHVEAEFRFQRRDGSLVWVSLHASMLGDGFSLAYCADITSRKEAEEALRRYELLSGHSRDIILFVSRDGRILEANAAAEAAYGFTREELLCLAIKDLRGPETTGLTDAQIAEADARGILFEAVHRRKDGSTFPVEVSSRGALINGARTLISIVRDITDRRRAEEEIRLLKHSIDVHYDAAYWMGRDNRFVYVNDAAGRALGYKPEELLGKAVYDVNPLSTPEGMKEVWEGLRKGGSFVGESVHRRKDGTEFPVEIATTYVQFEGREYACGFARDITEKRKLEEQLRQAQKMEAIGTLAGGVAHDFNNILTVIMGLGNVIQMTVGPDDRVRPHIDQIVASSQKAADLVQSLLAFSRKQRITLAPHEVNAVVESTAKLLKRLLTEDITLKVDLSAGRAAAMLDVSQIDQVLMNLATNARDAMPQGGSLTIRTRIAELDETFRKTHGFGKPGRYVCLSVSDTGIGMDEKTMVRIFDPFFTTKEVGKGTGLGLASVYGIVKQHGGYIAVRSGLLEGTTFDVYLRLVETPAQQPASASPSLQGGSETILVIEDDGDVRKMITKILSDRGYVTLEADDGDVALKVFREHKDSIGLVIMDVVMPGKNGREVFDEIARIDPEARAIFMSGYTGDIVIDKGVQKESVDFLQKPLSVAGLLAKVREVLDR